MSKNNHLLTVATILLLSASCSKDLPVEYAEFYGYWKCKGMYIEYTGTPWIMLEGEYTPYENCGVTISEKKIIFHNGDEDLKLKITDYTYSNDRLEIVAKEWNGQKRELFFIVDGNEMHGSFFSRDGFIDPRFHYDEYEGEQNYQYHIYTRQ